MEDSKTALGQRLICLHKSYYTASPLQVVAIPKTVALFLGSYTIVEAGGRQFFLLDVKPTSSYTRNYLATARHGLV